MVEENIVTEEKTDDSWLIFKLMKQTFAVNCQDVAAIFRVTQEVVNMQGYSNHVRGVIDFRGNVLPLLELRSVLGIASFEQEHKEFKDMIEMRIDDHKRWVAELNRCIDEDDIFSLATDPTKCAFGKWYYNFHTDNASVAFDLRKVEEPHRKMHEMAIDIIECKNIQDLEQRKKKESQLLTQVKEEYMPKVVELLTDMEEIYKNGYREMCIVIEHGDNKKLGLLVDEVTVVESITKVDSESLFNSAFSSSCISHVAKSQNITGEVFVLDKEALFNRLFL
ncbi:MAG: chemotaxis protein CheW [Aminipila sp.]